MNFEKKPLWLIGGITLSMALAFSACGDSTSSSTTEDDFNEQVRIPDDSKQSDENTDKKDSTSSSTIPTDLKLAVPTNLEAVRLAPSVWQLTFKSSGSMDAFIVQRMPVAGGEWKDYKEVKSGRLVLDGASNGGYYYRVAAKKDKSISDFSEEILVSNKTPYSDGIVLETPSVTANINQEKTLELFLSDKLPGDGIVNSTYNLDSAGKAAGSVYFQARFVYGNEYVTDTVKAPADQFSISKTFNTNAELCNSFAQVRVVWTDKNKESDYSEWSKPMGTKAGTESGLVNANNRCKADTTAAQSEVVVEEGALPGPTNPKVEQLSDGSWMMQWEYTPSKDRPETGFIVQKLDAEKNEWAEFDSTGSGVYRCVLGKLTGMYNYFRVVAYDKDGRSAYSADVLATGDDTGVGDGTMLQTPNGLTFVRIAPSVWEMSWKYDIAKEKPENKFIIQSAKLKNFEWKTIATVKGENRVFLIEGKENIENYYRMATTDGKDTSYFTEALQLTPSFPYRADMNPATPVLGVSLNFGVYDGYEANMDTASHDKIIVSASVAFDVQTNIVDKNIHESEYTDTVYYQARWFTPTVYDPRGDQVDMFNDGELEGRENLGATWDEDFAYEEPSVGLSTSWSDSIKGSDGTVKEYWQLCEDAYGYNNTIQAVRTDSLKDDEGKFTGLDYVNVEASVEAIVNGLVKVDKEYFFAASKISTNTALCIENHVRGFCDIRIQVRIVWTDRNGETDYSEWTLPTGIGGGKDSDKLCYNH
jgi:hypothetical protein